MTTTITPEIAQFARAVRDALADLPADERDELTDGLEADLAEAYAEDLRRELPDPDEYATELRNAAGLPKGEVERSGMLATLAVSLRRTKADLAGVVDRNPSLKPVAEFLVAIRPLWWVARAWVAAWVVAAMVGFEGGFAPRGGMYLVLLAFVIVSVQWGRRRWIVRGVPTLVVVGNVVAALLVVPVLTMANSWTTQISYPYYEVSEGRGPDDLTGVYLDGVQVTNIFPYDASGKPIDDVQLFDQDGNALNTSVPGGNGCLDEQCDVTGLWSPRVLESGASVFNVFPLSMVAGIYGDDGALVADPDAVPEKRTVPLLKVPALQPAADAKVAPNNE